MPKEMPVQLEFPVVRRGFDPESVQNHLRALERYFEEQVAAAHARYANIEAELAEARKREEAVHLTFVAATKTKEELLVNAQRQAEETVARAREESESLQSEAKKEAFRLVSDARQTAERETAKARNEAEELTAKAAAAADATRDAARREAIEMINTVESDTASLVEARETALADMRRQYEEEEAELASRVEVLRNTAADLEARLRAIASGGLDHAATLVSGLTQEPTTPIHDSPAPATATPLPVAPYEAPHAVHHAHNGADLTQAPNGAGPTTEPMAAAAPSEAPMTRPEPTDDEIERALAAAVEELSQGELASTEVGTPSAEVAAEVIAESADADADRSVDHETAADEPEMHTVPATADDSAVETGEDSAGAAEVEPVAAETGIEPEAVADDAYPEPVADIDAPAEVAPAAEIEPPPYVEPAPEIREPVAAGVGARAAAARDDEYGARKGSYYSRRSAKLPRIGTEAGRSALAAANAIRGATRGNSHSRDDDTTA